MLSERVDGTVAERGTNGDSLKRTTDAPGVLEAWLDDSLAVVSLSPGLADVMSRYHDDPDDPDRWGRWLRWCVDGLHTGQEIYATRQTGPATLIWLMTFTTGKRTSMRWHVTPGADGFHLRCLSHRAGEKWCVLGPFGGIREDGLTEAEARAMTLCEHSCLSAVPMLTAIS